MARSVTGARGTPEDSAWLPDTSVVLDIRDPEVLAALPSATAVSVVTLAELAARGRS